MWTVRIALNRPYTLVVLALLVLGIGPLIIAGPPTDVFPNINIPVMAVVWNYGGRSAEDMANRIVAIYERTRTTADAVINAVNLQNLVLPAGTQKIGGAELRSACSRSRPFSGSATAAFARPERSGLMEGD